MMPAHPIRAICALFPLALLSAAFLGAQVQPSSPSPEPDRVIDTVKAIFDAAKADDLDKFHAVTTRGFYMFENGARFDGDAIMALIKADHAAGKRYDWNITDPDVHIIGNTAWIAYVNKGSLTDASGTQNLQWQESAFLHKEGDTWKISFFHSNRIPEK
jgi:hypothetical protein